MNVLQEVGTSTILVWALIGLIGGYMTGRMRQRGSSYIVVCVIVGIIAAMIGGWIYVALFGVSEQNEYISLVTAVVMCCIGLWIYSLCTRHRDDTPPDDGTDL